MGTGSIAQQTGANAALAEFFGMVLDQRFDVMNDRRDAAIDKADDLREYNLDLGRYNTQHENYMDELGLRQEIDGISSTAQGDTNPVQGIFDFVSSANETIGNEATKIGDMISGGSQLNKPDSPDALLKKAKSIEGTGPALNARFPLMKGDSPEADAALVEFFGKVLEQRQFEQDDRREARIDRRGDLRDYRLDTGRYDTKHENQMDEIYAREYGVDAVRPDGVPSGDDSSSNNPVSSALAGFVAGDPAPFDTQGNKKNPFTQVASNLGAEVGHAAGLFFDTSEFDAPRDSDDERAQNILTEQSLTGATGTPDYTANPANDDALVWAIDKLSRPLFAVNEVRHRFYQQDEGDTNISRGLVKDSALPDWLEGIAGGLVAPEGGDLLGALAGTQKGDISHILGGLKSGFTGKDKTLSQEIIAENAAKDPEHNIFDNKYYQIFGGLGADLAIDPVNFVGVGLARTPVIAGVRLGKAGLASRAVRGVLRRPRITTPEEAAQLIREDNLREMTNAISEGSAGYGRVSSANEEIPIEAETLYDLLGGNYKGSTSYATNSQVASAVNNRAIAINNLVSKGKVAKVVKGTVPQGMRDLQKALQTERDTALSEFGSDSIRQSLARDLQIKISHGEASVEDLDNLDTTFTSSLLADKGVITKANAYEGALYEVAKNLKESGYEEIKTISDVETYHAKLTRIVEESQARVDSGLSTSEAGLNSAKKHLAKFEKDYADELDKIDTPLKDINEILGPKWQEDYRFTDEEGIQMYRQASHMARTSDDFKVVKDRINALNPQVKGLERAIAKAKSEGKTTGGFERSLETTRRKLARQEKIRDRMHADYFVRLVKARLKNGAGFKEFTDGQQAVKLDRLIKQVRAESGGVNPSSNVKTTGEAISDTDQPIDWLNEVEDLGSSFKIPDHSQFSDRGSQLESMDRGLTRQLGNLRNPRSFPQIEASERRMLTDIPAALKGSDPDTLLGNIRQFLDHNDKSGEFSFNPTGDAEADSWLNDVVGVLDDRYQDSYNKDWKELTRRLNETKQGEAEAKQLSLQDEALNNMFSTKAGGKLESGMGIHGPLTPSIKIGEEDVKIGSNLHKKLADDGTFPVGNQSTKTSEINSKVIDQLVDDALQGTKNVKHQSVARLRDLLIDYGKYVPDSPTKAAAYIVKHAPEIRRVLQPHIIEAMKQFKKTNGLSIRDARIFRDRALGKVVGGTHGWAMRFPKGVTRDEFMYLATNNEKTFHDLFAKGPFSMKVKSKEGTKALTDRGASPQEFRNWANSEYEALMKMSDADRADVLRKAWEHTTHRQGAAKSSAKEVSAVEKPPKLWPTSSQKREIAEAAKNDAFNFVGNKLKHNKLYTRNYDTEFTLYRGLDDTSTEEELVRALAFKRGDEYARMSQEAAVAKSGASYAKVKEIDAGLRIAKKRLADEKLLVKKAYKEAKEGRKVMQHRMREDAVLRILAMKTLRQNKSLSIQFLGQDFLKVPTSAMMFKAAERAGGLPGIKQIRQTWADAFKPPSTHLSEPELKLARARAMSLTPNIIEGHIKKLLTELGDVPAQTRVRVFKAYLKGHGVPVGTNNVQDNIERAFEDLLPYFSGKYSVGESVLTIDEINRFLPQQMTLKPGMESVNSTMSLVKAMRKGKTIDKANSGALKDPYQMSWELRVAVENAIARKATEHTINSSFGVKSGAIPGSGKNAASIFDPETTAMVKKLEGLGWERISELGNTHYFPGELVPEVHKLLDMMEPRNLTKVGALIDQATGYWKTVATVYNPGYYSRNGAGEIISAWFDGVKNPMVYKQAASVMKYARSDGKELAALQSQFPLLEHLPSGSPNGSRALFTLNNGKKVTVEDVLVAYHDQGLKTGFVNTEFDRQMGHFSKMSGTRPAKIHRKVQGIGEGYEDFLRMGHFIDALRKSGGRTLSEAAQHAAKKVRKFHFDYTDVTNFEKMTMLRVFPFYKWTRKALPLMVSMLFTKPGKVMVYPKIMNAVSNAQGSPDELVHDVNGFAPNYQGIVPSWIRDLWGYKIAEDSEGNDSYFNLATPQMDIYKGLAHPDNLLEGLLHPGIRQGYEQGAGKTLGMNMPIESNQDRLDSFLRTTPQGNMVGKGYRGFEEGKDNALTDPTTGIDEQFLSFLTGLGVYENNPDRQQGELMRQAGQ